MDDKPARRAAAAARWAFLGEWLAALQDHLYYHEREETDCGTLHSELKSFCVYIPWPPETTDAYAATLATLREAMELVALALRLDRDAWLVIAQPGNAAIELFDPDDYDDCDLTPSYIIKAKNRWAVATDNSKAIAAVEQLLVATQGAPRSSGYTTARHKILTMDRRGRLAGFQIPLSLLFAPKAVAAAAQRKYMEIATRTTEQVATLGRRDAREGGANYPFRLTDVIFHYWEFPVTFHTHGASSIHRYVTMALTRGISIPEISLKLRDSDPVDLGHLLRLICGPLQDAPRNGAIRAGTVDSLIVTMATDAQFVALCSAIANSQTLSRLTTYAGMSGKGSVKWRALGFALLSRASTSSVCELSIQEDWLRLSDAEAFADALVSQHPHEDLDVSAPTASLDGFDRMVRLCDHAVMMLEPDGDELLLKHLQLSPEEYYHVMAHEAGSEWMKIFAPGYGVVSTRCQDVVDATCITRDATAAAPGCRLTHLQLAINKCDAGALTSLIRATGASLVALDITVQQARLVRADDVRVILTTCPKLKMLKLENATIRSMDIFTDAYEQGLCQIVSLVLKNVHVSNPSLHDFAAALADPTRRIAQTLIEFRYDFNQVGCAGDVARPDAKGIKSFFNMLASNATLSFFELALDKPFYKRFLRRFQDRDRRLLVSHPSDLPRSSKLAFLSCIRVEEDRPTKRPRANRPGEVTPVGLARELVERIFVFARKRIYRVVSASPIVSESKRVIT